MSPGGGICWICLEMGFFLVPLPCSNGVAVPYMRFARCTSSEVMVQFVARLLSRICLYCTSLGHANMCCHNLERSAPPTSRFVLCFARMVKNVSRACGWKNEIFFVFSRLTLHTAFETFFNTHTNKLNKNHFCYSYLLHSISLSLLYCFYHVN